MSEFINYVKRKEYLVCVDSDGCAIDSMDIKHFRSFGPCMIDEWDLHEWKDAILKRWNDINLYTLTRGINRFKGLLMALKEINEQYIKIEDLSSLENWATTTNELSNASITREIEKNPSSVILKKALSWSNAVNASIKRLPEEEILPFEMVKEALEFAHQRADVAIVSSANLGAVLDEWKRHELLQHTDIVLAQNAGTKAYCIQELLKKGYNSNNVVMCGDALGDLEAANKNGVHFYPILVRHEKESWEEFIALGFEKLLSNEYSGNYQEKKNEEFLNNLGGK
jgi:phosphoglycolate phosphatase-like HAD superfamily hydrolase